jgi:hypothetical protein
VTRILIEHDSNALFSSKPSNPCGDFRVEFPWLSREDSFPLTYFPRNNNDLTRLPRLKSVHILRALPLLKALHFEKVCATDAI